MKIKTIDSFTVSEDLHFNTEAEPVISQSYSTGEEVVANIHFCHAAKE